MDSLKIQLDEVIPQIPPTTDVEQKPVSQIRRLLASISRIVGSSVTLACLGGGSLTLTQAALTMMDTTESRTSKQSPIFERIRSMQTQFSGAVANGDNLHFNDEGTPFVGPFQAGDFTVNLGPDMSLTYGIPGTDTCYIYNAANEHSALTISRITCPDGIQQEQGRNDELWFTY